MKEQEVKILEVNRKKIEEILANLGAKRVFDGEIETLFFDFKDQAIAKAKNLFRLRKEGTKTELTFKAVLGNQDIKVAEEYTVEISDLGHMKKILEYLGLFVVKSMGKHRTSYSIDRMHFDIDRYAGDYGYIPELLEIEGENIDAIHNYAEILGFRADECLPWSTHDLILYYSVKKDKT